MDVGHASGWNLWPLENGDWAWRAWVSSNGGLPRSGIETSEAKAQAAAQGELELMLSEANGAAQERCELPVQDDPRPYWNPQS